MRVLVSPLLLLVLLVAGCESDAVSEAKKALVQQLKDPSSVQWRDVRDYTEGVVCGQYNAKNSMGGYVGFKTFIYNGMNESKEIQNPAPIEEAAALCNDGNGKRLAYLEKELRARESLRDSVQSRFTTKYVQCMAESNSVKEYCQSRSGMDMVKMAESTVASARDRVAKFKQTH